MWKGDKMNINIARENVLTYTAIDEENMTGLDSLLSIILGPQANPEAIKALSNMKIKEMSEMSLDEMEQVGLTKNQSLVLYSSMLLIKRYIIEKREKGGTIRTPDDAAKYLMQDMRNLNQEHFVVLYLNTKNEIIKRKTIFIGTLNSAIVHPREIFREAVKVSSCAAIVVGHNHPSGSSKQSMEDIHVTRRLAEAGKLIGIEVLDSLVIGDNEFVSLKEKGYL